MEARLYSSQLAALETHFVSYKVVQLYKLEFVNSDFSRQPDAATAAAIFCVCCICCICCICINSTSCTTKGLHGITSCCLQCRFRSVLEMRAAMREFARAARDYSRRYSAAIKMQSLARGFLARRAFAHLVAAHHHQLRLEQAKAAAALAVIAPWAATFLARCHFLRLRSVCPSDRPLLWLESSTCSCLLSWGFVQGYRAMYLVVELQVCLCLLS